MIHLDYREQNKLVRDIFASVVSRNMWKVRGNSRALQVFTAVSLSGVSVFPISFNTFFLLTSYTMFKTATTVARNAGSISLFSSCQQKQQHINKLGIGQQ